MSFYRAMHYSAKRVKWHVVRLSVRPSVCLSVTLVNHDHRGWNTFALCSPKAIHLLPGEHGEILGRPETRGGVGKSSVLEHIAQKLQYL